MAQFQGTNGLFLKPASPPPLPHPPSQPKVSKKQSIDAGSPTLECPLVAKPGTSHPYFAICGSATSSLCFRGITTAGSCSSHAGGEGTVEERAPVLSPSGYVNWKLGKGFRSKMNAVHTKELLLTSHLQSPPGHRQDPFNKLGSETPIVQNLQLATGYHHSLRLCKIKDLEEGWGRWKL